MNVTVDNELAELGYFVTMPDGSVWRVPVVLIAMDRAKYYAEHDEISLNESLNEDTTPLFKGDPDEIADWAKNNMNWEDVVSTAIMVTGPTEYDMQDGWVNGEIDVH